MFKIKPIHQPILYVHVNVWTYQTTQEEYFNLFVIDSNNDVIFMLNNKAYSMDLYDLIMRELALDFINPDNADSVIFVKCEKKSMLPFRSRPEYERLRMKKRLITS